jgi:hypothetical protein
VEIHGRQDTESTAARNVSCAARSTDARRHLTCAKVEDGSRDVVADARSAPRSNRFDVCVVK